MAAIFVPSGDQTGPQPPRESIDRVGTGAIHRSVGAIGKAGEAGLVGLVGLVTSVAGNVNIWFVPSRKRLDIGATSARARRWPSGDQVGIPGWASVSCTFVTVPVATS